jgi:thioredoxin-related protein
MRHLRWIVLMLVAASPVRAEIHFLRGPLAGAIDRATAEQKPVMIDFITDWCRWCDTLDRNTYSDQAVASFINDNVVPIKIDAEKGEGIAIASTYNVHNYPTILLITPGGKEIDRILGYLPPEPFLASMTDLVHGVGTVSVLTRRVEESPGDPAAVYALAHRYTERNDLEEASTYFSRLMTLDPKDSLGHREEALFMVAYASFHRNKDITRMKEFAKEFPASDNFRDALQILIAGSLKNKEGDDAKAYLASYMQRWPDDAGLLNSYAWTAQENEVNLDHAAEIAGKAVAMTPDSGRKAAYLDTQATVEFKRGDVAGAVTLEQTALNLLKDPKKRKPYEAALEKFRAGSQVTQGK